MNRVNSETRLINRDPHFSTWTVGLRKRRILSLMMCLVFQFIWINGLFANLCRLKKPDERNVCLSRIEDTDYYCQFVQSPGLNYLCYAIAQRKPKVCSVITDPDIRKRCDEGVQKRLAQDEEERQKRERIAQQEALKKAQQDKLNQPSNSNGQPSTKPQPTPSPKSK